MCRGNLIRILAKPEDVSTELYSTFDNAGDESLVAIHIEMMRVDMNMKRFRCCECCP